MNLPNLFTKFYLDKEKDIVVKLFKSENQDELRTNTKLDSEKELATKIKNLPIDKVPIIIAGGSFNTKGRETKATEEGIKTLKKFVENVNKF